MESDDRASCTAFEGFRRIAKGALVEVAVKAKEVVDRGGKDPVLIFDDATGEQVEVDFRGTTEEVRERLAVRAREAAPSSPGPGPGGEAPRGPGRPKLGVVAREV